jgi:hypothetical protein
VRMSILHVENNVISGPWDGVQHICDVAPDDDLMNFK